MNILIGTKNAYKSGEIIYLLEGVPGVTVHKWEELNLSVKVEENQNSLKANAEKKAREISQHTGWYVLTSDNGVDIPGLGEKWDMLRNQRIVGEDSTDLEKVGKILSLMKGLKGEERKAESHMSLALALKDELIWSAEQITDTGYIVEELPDQDIPEYKWMGHIFYYPQYGKVYNKLSEKELEEIRNLSMKNLKENLKSVIEDVQLRTDGLF